MTVASLIKTRVEPVAQVIDLTPERAAELLDRNPRNRKISPRYAANVLRAIENDEWELNGEAIKVDVDGYILDGQHRCWAVVESGKTIKTFIIEGLPAHTQDTMDTGKSRSLMDVLSIHKEASASALASIVRGLRMRDRFGVRAALANAGTVTTKECLAYLDENPWIREIVQPCRKVAREAKVSASVVSVLWVEFAELDAQDAEWFFDHLASGESLDSQHPVYVLRKSLAALDKARGERNRVYVGALVIKAWNKFRDGESISMLRYRPGGSSPEPFPEAH